jgi:membrane dipeptidase
MSAQPCSSSRRWPVLLASALLFACSGTETPPTSPASEATVEAVHARILTLDTHVDIPFEFATDQFDPLDGDMQVNLQKMRDGGLDAAFFVVYVAQTPRSAENYAAAQIATR